MSKTVRNETRKLLASRYNSMSVGFLLGGCFIPYIAVAQKADDILGYARSWLGGNGPPLSVFITLMAFSFSASLAIYLSRYCALLAFQ